MRRSRASAPGRPSASGCLLSPRDSTCRRRRSGRSRCLGDLLGAYVGGRGWRLSAGHFAERHALIVIIALGETIVALGLGATTDLSTGVIVAAALGLAIAFTLWWAYFDVVAIVAERKARSTTGRRSTMARDSYSYLHLPMVAGSSFAVGVKKTMGDYADPLKVVPAVALCGGIALYLLAHVLFRLRTSARSTASASSSRSSCSRCFRSRSRFPRSRLSRPSPPSASA